MLIEGFGAVVVMDVSGLVLAALERFVDCDRGGEKNNKHRC